MTDTNKSAHEKWNQQAFDALDRHRARHSQPPHAAKAHDMLHMVGEAFALSLEGLRRPR